MNRAAALADRSLASLIAFAERQTANAAFGAAVFCLLVSLALPWVNVPLGKDPRGFQFGLFQDISGLPRFQLESYGVAGILVLAFALAMKSMDRRAAYWGGVALLVLALAAPLQIAFSNPGILRRLASEFDQQQRVNAFTAHFLPVNRGQSPEIWTSLDFATVWTRGVSAWYFLTLGWYFFLGAALIVFFKGLLLLDKGRSRNFLTGALLLSALFALFAGRASWANSQLNQAYLAQARGDSKRALELYRDTMRLDRWYALGPEICQRIGELHESLGILDSPEYHLFRGQVLENQGVQPMAIYEYRLASRGRGDLGIVARREASRAAASLGLTLYRYRAFGGALAQWTQAYEEDPFRLEAMFYSTRAHFDIAQYRESIAAGEVFCRRSSNTYASADVYSDMGDSYTKLNDFPRARTCYAMSFKLDYTINARGLGALTGN